MQEATAKIAPNRLKELRTERGLSLDALAHVSGVSRNSINAIENRTAEMTFTKARQLAPHLGVKPSGLMVDEDVELRASADTAEILEVIADVDEDDRMAVIEAAHNTVMMAKRLAGRMAKLPLQGDADLLMQFAGIWNRMDDGGRKRMLGVAEVAGFADLQRDFEPRVYPNRIVGPPTIRDRKRPKQP